MDALTYRALTSSALDDYLDFFDHRAFTDNPRWSSCYCYFPLHDPQRIDWESRTGTENRSAMSARIRAGDVQGYLAYAGATVVGWCNAGPWSQFPMLRDVPEPDSQATGAIFCFIIAPDWRGKGVATGLLDAACDGLRGQGMKAIRARAVKSADAAKNHFGPLSMYLAAGFEIVREGEDGSVFVRKDLGG